MYDRSLISVVHGVGRGVSPPRLDGAVDEAGDFSPCLPQIVVL